MPESPWSPLNLSAHGGIKFGGISVNDMDRMLTMQQMKMPLIELTVESIERGARGLYDLAPFD
jgi:hypothetical protein